MDIWQRVGDLRVTYSTSTPIQMSSDSCHVHTNFPGSGAVPTVRDLTAAESAGKWICG